MYQKDGTVRWIADSNDGRSMVRRDRGEGFDVDVVFVVVVESFVIIIRRVGGADADACRAFGSYARQRRRRRVTPSSHFVRSGRMRIVPNVLAQFYFYTAFAFA